MPGRRVWVSECWPVCPQDSLSLRRQSLGLGSGKAGSPGARSWTGGQGWVPRGGVTWGGRGCVSGGGACPGE